MASSKITLQATGLNFQPNQLAVDDGSLVEASNVIIRRDNVIERRRGFKLYGDPLPTSTDRVKQIMEYRDVILRHYGSKLQYDLGTGNFVEFTQMVNEVEPGLRIKSVSSNNNFYFTTSDGVKKISSTSSNLSNSPILNSGGVKATDVKTEIVYTPGSTTGFLPVDSTVAYRAVWGIKDSNNNLILGVPSSSSVIYNPITPVMLRDFNSLLQALDNISLYNQTAMVPGTLDDGDYSTTFSLPITASSADLRSNLVALTTKLDNDIFNNPVATITAATFANGVITFTATLAHGLATGDYVEITGVDPTGYNGTYQVTVTSPTVFTVLKATDPGTYVAGGTVRHIKYERIETPQVQSVPATADQLASIQAYLSEIITTLQNEPISVIPAAVTYFIDNVAVTTTVNVSVSLGIPEEIIAAGINQYFLQIYRTDYIQAINTDVLQDLSPSEEYKLAYEAFPTSTELMNGTMEFIDITPQSLLGANLYTNPSTGEGILQANEKPPLAKDIARFKNVVFYANTKTLHKKIVSLLGVQNLIDSMETHKLEITNGTDTSIYTFVKGEYETTSILINQSGALLDGKYFILYSAYDKTKYYFKYSVDPTMPVIPVAMDGITVGIYFDVTDTIPMLVDRTINAINVYNADFTAFPDVAPNTFIVQNSEFGMATDANQGTTTFITTVLTQGVGEDAANKQILLSQALSAAVAIEETARSLVSVVNRDAGSPVTAYYLSSVTESPGKMLFEAKTLSSDTFYIVPNTETLGVSFNPDLTVDGKIIDIQPIGLTQAEITTDTPHGLTNQDTVVLAFTQSTPEINGVYTITVTAPNKFVILQGITMGATGSSMSPVGLYQNTVTAEKSDNEVKINRVYFSKLQQPEAVPLINYLDVGDSDKQILRIYPLRDSLFVFKEEGLYRISGEVSPFSLALFDSSCLLTAPDSLGVTSNKIFGFTKQGISTVSEAGVDIASRPIDTEILKLGSNNYPSFKTATWGLGYESDNSYLVWTIKNTSDTEAQICYRYSSLTGSWTTYDKSNQCGIVKIKEDKLFLGVTDTNYIEEERKTFTRLDYADREFDKQLTANNYLGNVLKFSVVSDIKVGDVIGQLQYLTDFEFNALLKKLDTDQGIPFESFFDTFKASNGADIKAKLVSLAMMLDTLGLGLNNYASIVTPKSGMVFDTSLPSGITKITQVNHGLVNDRIITITGNTSNPQLNGTWTVTVIDPDNFTIPVKTESNSHDGIYVTEDDFPLDIRACFNGLIQNLNMDNTVVFYTYRKNDTSSTLEAVVVAVDGFTKRVTLDKELPFHLGIITVYKAFASKFTYSPITMGDSLGLKQLSETTLMFENKRFSIAKVEFATDVLPEYIPVTFTGDGSGLLGHENFGSSFFGGGSHSTPFRTYVPRQCQRCRYLSYRFTHAVANENVSIFGMTVTGRVGISTRAFRG